jgi:hypothetical protein
VVIEVGFGEVERHGCSDGVDAPLEWQPTRWRERAGPAEARRAAQQRGPLSRRGGRPLGQRRRPAQRPPPPRRLDGSVVLTSFPEPRAAFGSY